MSEQSPTFSGFITCKRTPNHRIAFTRLEVCVVLAALGLLTLVVAPALASNKSGGERAACFNHMRLLGQGIASWAGDHQQSVPWRVSFTEGGTLPTSGSKPGTAWYEYSVLSNELRSPKVLTCPADSRVIVASSFYDYRTSGFQANSTSYALGLEVFPEEPRSWLSSDRHLRPDPDLNSPCTAKVISFSRVDPVNSIVAWTNNVHGTIGGHVLVNDGSVSFAASEHLREVLTHATDSGSTHFLRAR